jgi:2',3'-cyclic-nucleotide 2'-phosphodiesterase (5'-nucleotidase family)
VKKLFLYSLLCLAFTQCHHPLTISNSKVVNIKVYKDSLQLADERIAQLINPYKKKLDSSMNSILCYNEQDLSKQLPEGTLGNFLCDELMTYAKDNFSRNIDFCMYNNGGIRIPLLAKGNITVGKIYELAPFDNFLVLVALNGADCKNLFNLAAANRGTPCSKELRFKISNGTATDISINAIPFDSTRIYYILTNDYVANGGDKTEPMKKAISITNFNVIVRDVLIKSLQNKGKTNQSVKSNLDGRIEYNK